MQHITFSRMLEHVQQLYCILHSFIHTQYHCVIYVVLIVKQVVFNLNEFPMNKYYLIIIIILKYYLSCSDCRDHNFGLPGVNLQSF